MVIHLYMFLQPNTSTTPAHVSSNIIRHYITHETETKLAIEYLRVY